MLSSQVYSFDYARTHSPRHHMERLQRKRTLQGSYERKGLDARSDPRCGNATALSHDEAQIGVRGSDVVSAVQDLLTRVGVPLDLETTVLFEENLTLKGQVGMASERISVLQNSNVELEGQVDKYKVDKFASHET